MDIFEVLTHLIALALGGAAGSFLTLKVVKKSNQQNNNTVLNGSIVNGNYNNGNNNTNTHNHE